MRRTAAFGAAFVAALVLANLGGASLAAAAGGNPEPPGQAAKADENSAKSSGPGQDQVPPGQAKKNDESPAQDPPADQSGNVGAAPSAMNKDERKDESVHAAAARADASASSQQTHGHASKSRPAASVSSPPHAPAKGNSAVAHTHVIICHRTGSQSNPYVVINISMSAWLNGHSTHPDLDGHSDIVLKMGATPGEKMPRSACGHSGGDTPNGPPPKSDDPSKKIDDPRPSGDPKGSTSSPASPSSPAPASDPASPKAQGGRSDSGVAARLADTAVQGKLPFTGLRLWIVGLIGLALVAAGLALLAAASSEAALIEERADEIKI